MYNVHMHTIVQFLVKNHGLQFETFSKAKLKELFR